MDTTFHFQVPFTKIDKARRVVTGIATADNIDKVDDIVDAAASVEAFANWVGNIREMHGTKAVGKALSYKPVEFVGKDGLTYKGIEVEVYISKGAQDTWEKVLDGTLNGFSIGGAIEKSRPEFWAGMNKMLRRIVKYTLGELSLVDNPCNPVAMISVIKSDNGTLEYTLPLSKDADVVYCQDCDIAVQEVEKYEDDDEDVCPHCHKPMSKLGHVNKFDSETLTEAISDFLKGGANMEDLQKNENDASIDSMDQSNDEVTVSKAAVDLVASVASSFVPNFILNGTTTTGTSTNGNYTLTFEHPETVTKSDDSSDDETLEKSEDASDSVDTEDSGGEEVNTEELLKGLSSMMDEKLNEFKEQITATVDEKIEAVTKSAEEVSEEKEEVTKSDDSADDRDALIKALSEKVEALEAKSAVKKSLDADDESDDEVETVTKTTTSVWNGFFIPAEVVTALGYES